VFVPRDINKYKIPSCCGEGRESRDVGSRGVDRAWEFEKGSPTPFG
jgi:hypothetical protein